MLRSSNRPTVLVPYEGPDDRRDAEDIFIYLRPETNGVEVESRLLKVIKQCPAYHNGLDLVYMANLPGEFMLRNHIVERHYFHKLHFAIHGPTAFTPWMAEEFERQSGEPFESGEIYGAFEALDALELTPEGLFARWVDERDVVTVAGQTVKQIDGHWVIGYDIPALLHKNSRGTDIAVMLFRSTVGYGYFDGLVDEMYDQIIDAGVVNPRMPPARIFHYSRGPFEQLLDGLGHLVDENGDLVGLHDLSFARFCHGNGIDNEMLDRILRHPMFGWINDRNEYFEDDIYGQTSHATYDAAVRTVRASVAQLLLHAPRVV